MKRTILVAMIAMLFSAPANALDGESLYEYCTTYMNEIAVKPAKQSLGSLLCLYHVTGASDMISVNSQMGWGTVCYPKDVSSKQMVTAVTNWLRDNPKNWKTHS